jgi:hypothetical protein
VIEGGSGAVAVPGSGALTEPDGGATEVPGTGVSEPSGVTAEPAFGEVGVEPAVSVVPSVVVKPSGGVGGGGWPGVGACGTHADPLAPIPPKVPPMPIGACVLAVSSPPTVVLNPPGAGQGAGGPEAPICICADAAGAQASAAATKQLLICGFTWRA